MGTVVRFKTPQRRMQVAGPVRVSAKRFGLSQLYRGVGRVAHYLARDLCELLTDTLLVVLGSLVRPVRWTAQAMILTFLGVVVIESLNGWERPLLLLWVGTAAAVLAVTHALIRGLTDTLARSRRGA